MTTHDYRYSLIPGGAITDPRLEPRDFQVLALLGRHTKLGGWCWRSQVKMAVELKCGRATVQRSLDRLVNAGWVQVKLRGTKAANPNPEKQPFAAHFYRVQFDHEVPDDVLEAAAEQDAFDDVDPQDIGASQTGTPTDGHQGARLDGHGGAHLRGHQGREDSEGKDSESDRDARARDGEGSKPHVGAFNRRWPTASSDDQKRTKTAWDALGPDDWQPCLDGIEPFLKKTKADGRNHVIAGWKYIEERRWTLLPAAEPQRSNPLIIKAWSREWWAALLRRIERRQMTDFMLRCAASGAADWAGEREPVPAELSAGLQPYPSDGDVMNAWRPWFVAHRVNLPDWRKQVWVFLPSTGPPALKSA